MPGETIADFVDVVMGQSPPGSAVSGDIGIPLLNGPTEFGQHHPTPVQFTTDARKFANPGDLLFCVRGSTTGRMNWADQRYAIGRGIAAFRHRWADELQPFVRAVIEFQLPALLAQATGSTFPSVSASQLAAIPYPNFSEVEQRQIAHILGTLEDKIELNRQMNETLEAMARVIFRSWFVDFDPVRAKMEGRMPAGMDAATAILFPSTFQDSPLGEIPEGWEVVSLPEAIEVNPRRVLKKGTTAPYLHMQNLPTQGHRPDNWTHREFNSGTKFINGDTLLARITPCIENGKTGFVDFLTEGEVGWGSTEYIVFRPKPPLPVEFGYYLARSNDLRTFAIHNMTGTTGRQRVPASCFDYYQFPVPTTPIAQQFSEIVQPFMEKIRVNSEQSRTLSQIRETLLPKLLSGEIRVTDVDKRLEVKDGGTS